MLYMKDIFAYSMYHWMSNSYMYVYRYGMCTACIVANQTRVLVKVIPKIATMVRDEYPLSKPEHNWKHYSIQICLCLLAASYYSLVRHQQASLYRMGHLHPDPEESEGVSYKTYN